jgi:hypothetical protein
VHLLETFLLLVFFFLWYLLWCLQSGFPEL